MCLACGRGGGSASPPPPLRATATVGRLALQSTSCEQKVASKKPMLYREVVGWRTAPCLLPPLSLVKRAKLRGKNNGAQAHPACMASIYPTAGAAGHSHDNGRAFAFTARRAPRRSLSSRFCARGGGLYICIPYEYMRLPCPCVFTFRFGYCSLLAPSTDH